MADKRTRAEKVQALADRGATPGERQAAKNAAKRISRRPAEPVGFEGKPSHTDTKYRRFREEPSIYHGREGNPHQYHVYDFEEGKVAKETGGRLAYYKTRSRARANANRWEQTSREAGERETAAPSGELHRNQSFSSGAQD